jgi:hypothetical protein
LTCPARGFSIDWTTARFARGFNCPNCSRSVQIPRWYTACFAYPALVTGVGLAAFLDVSWLSKVVAAVVLVEALNAVFSTALRHVKPPTLQLVEDKPNEFQE